VSIQHGDNASGSRVAGKGLWSGLDLARQQLLDLGLRNNLLNYRLLKSRGVE
jgi:hypothetical protein